MNAFAPLNYTKEYNHRIVVGLSWDPIEQVGLLKELGAKIKGEALHHDLDLGCACYDAKMNFLSLVHAAPDEMSNENGSIYHSGDNVEGEGDGDDEEISVELKNLDSAVHHVVFFTAIKTGQNFNAVTSPHIHLSDGYTGRKLLDVDLAQAIGNDKQAFIFAHITRQDDGWALRAVQRFIDFNADWGPYLKNFLDAKS